jgi:predicted MFS family arabinose efflux permease
MKSNRLINFSLYYAISIFAITFTIASPIIIEIGESASQDISNMGLLMTLFSAGFVTGSLLTSILTRFFYKSLILNIAMLIQTIFILIFGFSASFALMLLVYFSIGMCGGFIETLVSLILPEINKGESGYYMNIS